MARPILRESEAARWEIVPIAAPSVTAPVLPPMTDPDDLLAAARSQAEALVASASLRAEQLVRAAVEEAEQLRTTAYREGFADGRIAGAEEWGEQRRGMHRLCGALQSAYIDFCDAQVPALTALATDAAERLLLEQLTLEPERVVALVRHSLARMTASTRITVRLHPEDLTLVESDPLLRHPSAAADVRFVPDSSIERGGCRVEGEQGELDATLESRGLALRELLAECHAS